jgi:hypothetical protein
LTAHELVIRFGRSFDIRTGRGAFLADVREITVPFADRESAESAQREITVCVRPVHDAGGEDYRPVVAGEVITEPAAIGQRRPLTAERLLNEPGLIQEIADPAIRERLGAGPAADSAEGSPDVPAMTCQRCRQPLRPCGCGIWWCPAWKHAANRPGGGGSHFCYLGQQCIAEPGSGP